MEITLSPEAAARVRAALGAGVDLSPAAVPRVLARLAEESPALYSELLEQLSGSDIRLDSERTLHRRHRRHALRRALFGWGEYESDAGDRLLAKRRVAAAVPIALAAVMVAAGGLSAVLHRPSRAPAAHIQTGEGRAAVAAPRSEPATAARLPQERTRPSRGSALLIPAAAPESAVGRTTLTLPPVPALPPVGIPGVGAAARTLPPSIVFTRAPVPAPDGDRSDAAIPHSPIVYVRENPADSGQPAEPHVAPSAGARASLFPAVKVGDRIPVRLVTAVIVAEGAPPVPVVAAGDDGSTWLGSAEIRPDRRIHVAFRPVDREVGGAAAASLTGVALDPGQLSPGLRARVVLRRGASAAAAISAIAQAAADYVRDAAHAGQLNLSYGGTQVAVGGPAPGWTYAASRIAEMLNPQAARIAIETFEVSPGAPCLILITGAS